MEQIIEEIKSILISMKRRQNRNKLEEERKIRLSKTIEEIKAYNKDKQKTLRKRKKFNGKSF